MPLSSASSKTNNSHPSSVASACSLVGASEGPNIPVAGTPSGTITRLMAGS